MELVLEKFILYFSDLYGDRPETFLEEDGRRYFLLYLRPIINGTGNYKNKRVGMNRVNLDGKILI